MLELKSLIVKEKKASIQDIFTLMIFMVGFGIFIIILAYVIPQVTEGMRNSEMNDSAAVREAFLETDVIATERLDSIYLAVFAGLLISVLISSFLIDSHPIFIPIYILLLGFAVVVGVILDNVYTEFTTNSALNQTVTDYTTIQTAIIGNYIPIIIAIGVLSMIIIFGKRRLFGERL